MADIIPFRQPQRECRLLITAADGRTRDRLVADATIAGYEVQICPDLYAASDHLAQIESDICLIDLDGVAGDIDEFCRSAARWRQPVTLLGLASRDLLESEGVDTSGSLELIPAPCPSQRLAGRLQEASRRLKLRQENERLQRQLRLRLHDEFVGDSDAADKLRAEILKVAAEDTPVVVTGERGSGTTLVARAIHHFSDRSEQPLISVDCSLQSSVALEQDLLGTTQHDIAAKSGRLHQAAGGTLVLENLHSVPLPMQKTLLEIVNRYCSDECPLKEHVRVIAILNEDADSLIQQGQLDARLHKFLNNRSVAVPSLQERAEDVVPLVEHFLQRLSVQEGRPPRRLAFDARELLRTHLWTGNVTQLLNVVRQAATIDSSGILTAESLRPWIDDELSDDSSSHDDMTLRDMERKLIETTFNRYRGNREQTANALSIGLRTLSGKLRDYGYPPRGGPGSNRQPEAERKAA